MTTINIAINGLGRIGRNIIRALSEGHYPQITLSTINGPARASDHAHLLRYDSVYGKFPGTIEYNDDQLIINQQPVTLTHHRQLQDLHWPGVDIVLECTGKFNNRQAASQHLQQGAGKVIVSAPCKDADFMAIFGVNHQATPAEAKVISAGSCTTNCLAPLAQLLHQELEITAGFMTTIHAMTGDQNLIDGSHKNLRRARSAPLSMIPTTTGAAKSIGQVIPELAGRLDGAAVRVPTANVSLIDLCVTTNKQLSLPELQQLLRQHAANSPVMAVSEEPLVSVDFNHHPASCIIDLAETRVIAPNMCRIIAWYDNEYAFARRMLDLAVALS